MEALSGGERSRVALALLSLIEGNLLLLDEPTNHLDLASQEILERAMQEYPGTVLLVSHDRALLEAVTTQVWLIEDRVLRVHGYGYTEFRRRLEENAAQQKKSNIGNRSRSQVTASKSKRSVRQSREAAAHRQVLEVDIEALEHRIQELEKALVEASEAGDAGRISELGLEHKKIREIYHVLHKRSSETTQGNTSAVC